MQSAHDAGAIEFRRKQEQRLSAFRPLAPSSSAGVPDRPYPGATDAAGGVDARRWRIVSSNPAMSAASTPPPSATIQTFEPSLACAGVAAQAGQKT